MEPDRLGLNKKMEALDGISHYFRVS
jgi:hypothetical protein